MLSHEEKLKRSAATMSIVSNTTLMLFKLVVGFYVGAVSIISEAIHSAVDLIAAIIASMPIGAKIYRSLPCRVQNVLTPVLIVCVLVLSTAYLVDASYNPFLYFRF